MWFPERKQDSEGPFGVWEANINAILPDGEVFFEYAGDCYMRGLICRVLPAETLNGAFGATYGLPRLHGRSTGSIARNACGARFAKFCLILTVAPKPHTLHCKVSCRTA